jgi:hypothetical protein
MVTRLQAGVLEFDSMLHTVRTGCGPPSLVYNRYTGLLPEVEAAGA